MAEMHEDSMHPNIRQPYSRESTRTPQPPHHSFNLGNSRCTSWDCTGKPIFFIGVKVRHDEFDWDGHAACADHLPANIALASHHLNVPPSYLWVCRVKRTEDLRWLRADDPLIGTWTGMEPF
jgi:hypothetical protein